MTIGKGAKSAKELRGIVEEIEAVNDRIKQLGEGRTAMFAEAKAKGFDTKTIRKIIALRKQDAGDRAKAQDLLDTYMHALDMAEPPPIFATIGALAVDGASREALIDAFKPIVPQSGEIILKLGGKPVRLFRDADGNAQAEDYVEAPPASAPRASRADDDDPPATSYAAPGAGRTLPKSAVAAAVERAEASAAAKRSRETKSEPAPA